MAKAAVTSVDKYLALQPEAARRSLRQVRRAIRKALPEADEGLAYNMPTYKVRGLTVLHFAGWKRHYSLYPATDGVVAAFKDELAPYEVNDKGTVRFPLSEPVPVALIERIAKFRAREVARRARGS